MPAVSAGMHTPATARAPDGRHHSFLDSRATRHQRAVGTTKRLAPVRAPALDHRLSDVPAADLDHLRPGHLPGALFDPLSMLNKAQTRFIGLSNFTFLMSRET